MADKELLENAAKAVAIKNYGVDGFFNSDRKEWWNPLTDDGDALRLAVKLDINIKPNGLDSQSIAYGPIDAIYIVQEQITSDKYAATRRAIVRAAAEIGKEMP